MIKTLFDIFNKIFLFKNQILNYTFYLFKIVIIVLQLNFGSIYVEYILFYYKMKMLLFG